MNLEKLKSRKNELDQAAERINANFQMIQGHKAEVDFWISELEKANAPIADAEVLPVE